MLKNLQFFRIKYRLLSLAFNTFYESINQLSLITIFVEVIEVDPWDKNTPHCCLASVCLPSLISYSFPLYSFWTSTLDSIALLNWTYCCSLNSIFYLLLSCICTQSLLMPGMHFFLIIPAIENVLYVSKILPFSNEDILVFLKEHKNVCVRKTDKINFWRNRYSDKMLKGGTDCPEDQIENCTSKKGAEKICLNAEP